MLEQQLAAYIIHSIEPEYDIENPDKAISALKSAFVVSLSAFVTDSLKETANVILPASVYTESSGTFVNVAGDWQSFNAIVKPLGESRPAWKILRVLANLFDVEGVEYVSSKEVKQELLSKYEVLENKQDNKVAWQCPANIVHLNNIYYRIADVAIYGVDSIVRRAGALQQTADGKDHNSIKINTQMAENLKVEVDQQINLKQNNESCKSSVIIDDSIPDNCIYLPNGTQQASKMGCSFSSIELAN